MSSVLPLSSSLGSTQDPLLSANWSIDRVNASLVWPFSTGEGVIVAVLDTGIDLDHVDLDANIWRNEAEIIGDGIDNDGNGYVDDVFGYNFSGDGASWDPSDVHSHGTHVAGLIAAEANNGIGIAGVAPDAEIMAVKVLGDNSRGSWSDLADGMDYAVENGARIINMSLGGSFLSSSIVSAMIRAQDAGVLVVVAAGNSGGSQALYPAALTEMFDNVISVASSGQNDQLAASSNYSIDGSTVDIAAPGVNLLSTTPNDQYGTKSGTSMAAPVVAGAAAVIWAANPNYTYLDVIAAIETTVDPIADLSKPIGTNGILNLAGAFFDGQPPPPVNEAPTLEIVELVNELSEDTPAPATIKLADLVVSDDGVGVTVLELIGGDIASFEIRDSALFLRETVSLDFETTASLTVEVGVDDPALGTGPEQTTSYTLSIIDVDEAPPAEPPVTPTTPGEIDGVNFWYSTADVAAGSVSRLIDLSGVAPDAVAARTSKAAMADGDGVRFDGNDVYRIADTVGLNIGGPFDGKTLSFVLETGSDIESKQFLYEQGGGTRGISVYVEDATLHMAAWNRAEARWGVLSVSDTVAAQQRMAISLVFDAAAGTITGWRDGTVIGVATGAGTLFNHGDDIGLGGVRGKTLDASGSKIGASGANWTGSLFEAAGHDRALSAEEVLAMHAGMATRWLGDAPPPPEPPENAVPVAVDDGPYSALGGETIEIDATELLANDTDLDGDILTIVDAVGVLGGAATIVDGVVRFTAAENHEGPARFAYTVTDGRGGEATAEVAINVTRPNTAPAAVDDGPFATEAGQSIEIAASTLLANDSDPDGDMLSVSGVAAEFGGAVALIDDVIRFTPDEGFDGEATFFYTIDDGRGGQDQARVVVDVAAAPPPEPAPDADRFDFITLAPTAFMPGKQSFNDFTLSPDGYAMAQDSQTWTQVLGDFVVTADTRLQLTLEAEVEGEIHGVLFANGQQLDAGRTLSFLGTQRYGIDVGDGYEAGSGARSFDIAVGDYITGAFDRIVFLTDDDRAVGADSLWSDVILV